MENCPINGLPCDKIKDVYVQKLEKNKISEFNCCGECIGNVTPHFVDNLLQNLGFLNKIEQPDLYKCECGSSIQDIKNKGIGCPECYNNFNDLILLIPRIQNGANKHFGKVPRFRDLETLRKNMNRAIKEERYEEAVIYRDKIKELEKIINGN